MGVPVNIPNDEQRVSMMGIENPATDLPLTHWYSGAATALPDSLTQGFTEVVGTLDRAVQTAGNTGLKMGLMLGAPDPTGPERPDWDSQAADLSQQNAYLQAFRDSQKAMDSLRSWSQTQLSPDKVAPLPQFAGNVARGLEVFGMGSLFGGVAAGASTLGATTGTYAYADTPDLDPDTRMKNALTQGLLAGAGAFLPGGVSGSIAKRIVAGAAINAGFGASSRYISSSILRNAGYEDMAKQYEPLDAKSVLADAVLGSAFGAFHVPGEKPDPVTIQDAFDARREAMLARGAAGIPATHEAMAADTRLQDQAVAALIQGKPVEIAPEDLTDVLDGSLVDPQRIALNDGIHEAASNAYGLLVDPTEPETQQVPVGLRARIEAEGNAALENPSEVFQRYAEDPRSAGGKIISGDLMAEVASPSVAEHPIEGHGIIAEHGAANRLANDLFEERMKQPPASPDELVLIMVGNAAVGKSTIAGMNAEHYNTVLDSNGADPQGLQQSINLALKSGRGVDVLLAHAPLEEAVARNIRRQAPDGRPVRIVDQADLAVKAPAAFGHAMDIFGMDPNVTFSVKETTPNGGLHVGPEAADFVSRLREENANRNNLQVATDAYTGAIRGANVHPAAKAVFEQGLDLPRPGVPSEANPGGIRSAAPGEGQAGRPAASASGQSSAVALDPMVREQASQLAYAHPDMDVQLPDGRTVKAAALQDEINRNLEQAKRESGLIDTAISCFLRTTL